MVKFIPEKEQWVDRGYPHKDFSTKVNATLQAKLVGALPRA